MQRIFKLEQLVWLGRSTTKDLERALGVTDRQIRRLLRDLRKRWDARTEQDENGAWRYSPGARRATFALPLTPYQAALLAWVARNLAGEGALASNLSEALHAHGAHLLPEGADRVFRVVPRPRRREERPEMMEQWFRAYLERWPVSFEYRNKRTGAWELRVVEPAGFGFVDGQFELDGWDRDREDWRSFRTQRMRNLEFMPDDVMDRRRDWDPEEIFRGAFRRKRGTGDHAVRLRVAPEFAYRVLEVQQHPTQRITARHDDGSVEVVYRLSHLDEILEWAMSMGAACVPLAPPELVEMARARAAETARAYGAEGAR